jgi:hypothetical protein
LLGLFILDGVHIKKHHYTKVILSNRMWPITN